MHSCLVKTPGNHIATGSKTVLKKSYCCMFMVLKVSENRLFSNYNQTIIKHFEDINRT